MNAVTQIQGELVDDTAKFFAPMSSDLVDGLIGEYNVTRSRITAMADAVRHGQYSGALHYFIEGNVKDQRHCLPRTVEELFEVKGAVAKLNAAFWNRALRMTDVLDLMPQKRRDEWFEQIEKQTAPDFEEATVRSTLGDLLAGRGKFFAERVDGIFRALSRDHVTNCPQGFNKRMILPRAITSYGTIEYSTAGVINDLRCVIAKFMGRDEPGHDATGGVIRIVRQENGQWMSVDGGSLRIRIYNGVGTAHLEVHPEMAWRLNAVIASLYPAAIPSQFRTKPKRAKAIKDFKLYDKPLPFAVIGLLAGMKPATRVNEDAGFRENKFVEIPQTLAVSYDAHDKYVIAEAERVLAAIGGIRDRDERRECWRFDYYPARVINEIVCSGCIPDHKSHQFYPTPDDLSEMAVALAGIEPEHACLEPSAGTGSLAALMRDGRSLCCVEISPLHCTILEAKGFKPLTKDFLAWQTPTGFDRIVMNPPFSEGRWQAHIAHAAAMLMPTGRLVAIIPASAKGKDLLPGLTHEWHGPFENRFPGASVSVVILVATKETA